MEGCGESFFNYNINLISAGFGKIMEKSIYISNICANLNISIEPFINAI